MVFQIQRPDIVTALPEYNPSPTLVQTQAAARVPRVEDDESRRRLEQSSSTRNERDAQAAYQSIEHPQTEPAPALLAWQIMTRQPLALSPEAGIAVARRLFREHGFRHIPLTNPEGRVIGVLTERDLLRRRPGSRVRPKLIAELATLEVLTATGDTEIRAIAATMLERHIGCIPIVDGDGRPLGIVTRSDILRALIRHPALELWI